MVVTDRLRLRGHFRIREAASGLVIVEDDNLVTTAGKAMLINMLRDNNVQYDTGLTYIGIGTGTTARSVGMTTLTTEVARAALTSKTRSGSVLTVSAFFRGVDSAYNIQELGIFGRSTATATLNTGDLFGTTLLNHDNSVAQNDLLIEYELTVS